MDTKIPAKKMKRLEKKKQKVAAFLELVKPTNEDSLVCNFLFKKCQNESFKLRRHWLAKKIYSKFLA